MSDNNKNNNLKTAENILRVLEMYSKEKSEWGVTELSTALNYSKSVTYRILRTLTDEDYLYQNSENNKYSLSNKFIKLGEIARHNIKLVEIASKEVYKLSQKTGETILVDIPDRVDSVCIDKMESSQNIKYTCGLGEKVPLYAGIGKVILAYLPEEDINMVIDNGLKQHCENTTTDEDVLKKELEEIRKQGYVVTYSEWNPGGIGIAAPIFDSSDSIVGLIGILGPEFRMKENVNYFSDLCKESANNISDKL